MGRETPWDSYLEPTDGKFLLWQMVNETNLKQQSKPWNLSLFPLNSPFLFFFPFLLDSDFWVFKSLPKIYICILQILYTESHISSPFWLLKSGIFVDCLTIGLQFCFALKMFIKMAYFKNASLSSFLLMSLDISAYHLVPSQMSEAPMSEAV